MKGVSNPLTVREVMGWGRDARSVRTKYAMACKAVGLVMSPKLFVIDL